MRNWILWSGAFAVLVIVGAQILVTSGAGASWDGFVGHAPDIASDKYTTVAAWEGGDPYVTMAELGITYEYAAGGWPVPHPRTPANFVVFAPLTLISDAALLWVMLPITAVIVVVCFWAAARMSRTDDRLLAVASLAVIPTIYTSMIAYGSATMIVPAAVAVAWVILARYPTAAGVILGAAAAVKLWPALVVLALLLCRHRAAWWAVGTGAVLTGLGLLLPGANIGGTVEAIRTAGGYFAEHQGNLSLVAAIGPVGLLVGVGVFVWGLFGSTDRLMATSILAALTMSPLSWEYYWLAAVPVVAYAYPTALSSLVRVATQKVPPEHRSSRIRTFCRRREEGRL